MINNSQMKEQIYKEIIKNLRSLLHEENDEITIMSTIACEVYQSFDYLNWVGFYRLINNNTLKVGPYQGTHGCLTITLDKGVCGKCASTKEIQIENDISKIPYHIACSSSTKSEIVLPVLAYDKKLISVFDLDSVEFNSFDEIDVKYLIQITEMI